MKTCDQIRPILLTDYMDGELDNDAKNALEKHLAGCEDCRKLVATAREDLSIMADESARGKTPPHVWQAIAQKIGGEKRQGNVAADFINRIRARIMWPVPAPVFAGIVLLVLSVSIFLYSQNARIGYGNGNLQYVSELFANVGTMATEEYETGYGTPIEEYFL